MAAISVPMTTLIAVIFGLAIFFIMIVVVPALSGVASPMNKALQVCEEGVVGKLKCIPTFLLWSTRAAGAPAR